jgi:hypothetical protein
MSSPKRGVKTPDSGPWVLEQVQQQLEKYISSVESLENENNELRMQLKAVEEQLDKERALVKETFVQAKQSWKEQALTFAEKERERERKKITRTNQKSPCNASFNEENVSASKTFNPTHDALASIANLRAQAVFNSYLRNAYTALLQSSLSPLLIDFDRQQGHIGIGKCS